MIVGTAKRLNKCTGLVVKYRDFVVSEVTAKSTSEYLSTTHSTLVYIFTSTRLRLLERMREYMAPTTRRLIYQMMIVPLLTYSSTVDLELLESITRRSSDIISDGKPVKNIHSEILFQCCKLVRQCLDGTVCNNLKNYFEITNHTVNTRNNQISLKLPKVKLSCAKKAFYFIGAKAYNNIPKNIRDISNFNNFTNTLKTHFSFKFIDIF